MTDQERMTQLEHEVAATAAKDVDERYHDLRVLTDEIRRLREEAEGLLSSKDEAVISRAARAAALEEAAKVADADPKARHIAAAIRALKDSEP